MATRKLTRSAREDARELARTPVADPYRRQLQDPFTDRGVPDDVALFVPRGGQQLAVARPARTGPVTAPQARRRAPGFVVTLGVVSLIEAAAVAVLGLVVIALVNLADGLGGDRSFYAGRDASYILLGVLDIGVAVALTFGAITLMAGRVSGRIALTAGQIAVIAFSTYWWGQDRIPRGIPLVIGLVATGVLLLSYQASITRWLGVLRPPQPE